MEKDVKQLLFFVRDFKKNCSASSVADVNKWRVVCRCLQTSRCWLSIIPTPDSVLNHWANRRSIHISNLVSGTLTCSAWEPNKTITLIRALLNPVITAYKVYWSKIFIQNKQITKHIANKKKLTGKYIVIYLCVYRAAPHFDRISNVWE